MKTAGDERKGIHVSFFDGVEDHLDGEPRVIISISRPGMGIMAHYAGTDSITALRAHMAECIALIDECLGHDHVTLDDIYPDRPM